jgi:hypothetical protein
MRAASGADHDTHFVTAATSPNTFPESAPGAG